jgi:hypothetical protein
MKLVLYFFVLIFLISCSPPPPQLVATTIEPTSTIQPSPEPTLTTISPTATAFATTAPTDTPILCDPYIADYCISDGHFYLKPPIHPPGNDSVERTYRYASTAGGTRDPHHGVEFENDFGTPVHAAADGLILFAGPDEMAIYSPWENYYGNLVVILHDNELSTLYAHLSRVVVEAGEQVQAGDTIGAVGRSGVAIGSHLHFEVRRGEAEDFYATVNPELWLMPRGEHVGALALSVVDQGLQFQSASITLQRYSASNQLMEAYYFDTYHPSLALGEENAGIGSLPAGRYRITLLFNGNLYERWVDVESGKLTQALIVVK